KVHPAAILPSYAHGPHEDAGMDLCAVEDVTLAPGVPHLVPTGLTIELPSGYEAQVRPRSGLAAKHSITMPNAPGTVDPGYRGELARMAAQVDGWQVVSEHHLVKQFAFPDFKTALDFVNKVGAIAEEEGHHPDLFLSWGKVEVKTWTHKIDGLTESDFILAAKIDKIPKN